MHQYNMKNIKTYELFNESLRNKLKGKSEDDVENKLSGLDAFKRIDTINRYSLSDDLLPTEDEIKNTLLKVRPLERIKHIKFYKLSDDLLPTEDEIKDEIMEMIPKDKLLTAVKLGYFDVVTTVGYLSDMSPGIIRIALIDAIKRDYYEIAKYLVNECPYVANIGNRGNTLQFFYKNNDIEILKRILNSNKFEIDIDEFDIESFIVNVVKDNNIELFELLIKNITYKKFIKYLLDIAKRNSSEEMISAIKAKKRSI